MSFFLVLHTNFTKFLNDSDIFSEDLFGQETKVVFHCPAHIWGATTGVHCVHVNCPPIWNKESTTHAIFKRQVKYHTMSYTKQTNTDILYRNGFLMWNTERNNLENLRVFDETFSMEKLYLINWIRGNKLAQLSTYN